LNLTEVYNYDLWHYTYLKGDIWHYTYLKGDIWNFTKILQYFTQKSVWAAWELTRELNIQIMGRKILKIATGLGVK
jgi:hypothetical protein